MPETKPLIETPLFAGDCITVSLAHQSGGQTKLALSSIRTQYLGQDGHPLPAPMQSQIDQLTTLRILIEATHAVSNQIGQAMVQANQEQRLVVPGGTG